MINLEAEPDQIDEFLAPWTEGMNQVQIAAIEAKNRPKISARTFPTTDLGQAIAFALIGIRGTPVAQPGEHQRVNCEPLQH